MWADYDQCECTFQGEGCDVIEFCRPGYWFDIDGACACVPTDDCDALKCLPWENKLGCECKPMDMGCDYIAMCERGYHWDFSDDICGCVNNNASCALGCLAPYVRSAFECDCILPQCPE